MKIITGIVLILITMTAIAQTTKSFHDFRVKTLEGEEFDLAQFRGKKVLVVNTASRCGFTPQYEGLQRLYDEYGGEGFAVIGFPANNFLRQEPGTNNKIREFCTEKYNVTFPMMAKISVKGKDIHPVYKWLTSKEENGKMDSSVKWNFQKYMVDENGKLVGTFSSKTKPYDPKIISWIKSAPD
ncbi:glutathione peroxidase [Bacteroidota bacterium]